MNGADLGTSKAYHTVPGILLNIREGIRPGLEHFADFLLVIDAPRHSVTERML